MEEDDEPHEADPGSEVLAGAAGEALAESALAGREADRELAVALRRPAPSGAAANSRYLDELGRRPVLPERSERQLSLAAHGGDQEARARLVEAFLPLIASVARLYRESPQLARVELPQEGVVGLLRALERFDPARGTPFWAYASSWVRSVDAAAGVGVDAPGRALRALRQLTRVRDAHRQALQETGAEPSRGDLSDRTGLSEEQLDNLLPLERMPRSEVAR